MKTYLAALIGKTESGTTEAGNITFTTYELTVDILNSIKRKQCEDAMAQGVHMKPEKVMFLSIIQLEH